MAQTRIGHMIDQLIYGTYILNGGYKHPLVPEQPAKTWLDVGSGNGEACTTMDLNWMLDDRTEGQRKVAVDPKTWESDDDRAGRRNDWEKHRMLYDENCPVWNDHFDIVTCLDTIEHLQKEEGERWLDHFEEVADRLIIIFTPCGFLPQGPEQGDKFDELERHLSGWEVEDFMKRGYCVYRTPNDFHHNPTGVEGDWAAILAWRNFSVEPK